MSLLAYVYTYLIGGITFIPLMVVLFVYMHPKADTEETQTENDHKHESLSASEIEEQSQNGILAYKRGWLTVTQEYLESTDDITSQTPSINENNSAYSTLYKFVKNNNASTHESIKPTDEVDAIEAINNDKMKSGNLNLKKHRYYAILKHGNLFLYRNQTLKDVKHVIVLSNQFVTLWPRHVQDGQLFTKRAAICLMKKDWSRSRRLSENFDHEKLNVNDIIDPKSDLAPPKGSFFIYCDTNIDKEDWYFTLIKGSKLENDTHSLSSNIHANTLHFQTSEMMDLIQTLYSSEGQLQTKWFNGILGRIFLSLKRTEMLQQFLESRITKRLNKIKTPGFLDKFQLSNLDPGDSVPFFTYPNLKEINPNGTVVVTSYVHYHGKMSCNLNTKVNLNFGGRFTQSQVDVELRVTLQKLEGPLVFLIKPPPSDRIWYSFEAEPIMTLKIEPVISARQMSYNIITNLIEKRFKEAIRESLVVPHYDDLVFFNTESEVYRGGIWKHSSDEATGTVPSEAVDDTDSISEKASLSSMNPPTSVASSDVDSTSLRKPSKVTLDKIKLSTASTLTDLSAKIRKSKSAHTVSVSGSNFLSDGSVLDQETPASSKTSLNKTLKKIGDWYNSKDEKELKPKEKVEMYSNRRRPRQMSNDKVPEQSFSPVEMFAKDHSRSNSRVSNGSGEGTQNPIELLRHRSSSSLGPPFESPKKSSSSSFTAPLTETVDQKLEEEKNPAMEEFSDEKILQSLQNNYDDEINELIEQDNRMREENESETMDDQLQKQLEDQLVRDFQEKEGISEQTSADLEVHEPQVARSNTKLHRKAPPPL